MINTEHKRATAGNDEDLNQLEHLLAICCTENVC